MIKFFKLNHNSQLRFRGFYEDINRIGECMQWCSNGDLAVHVYFVNDVILIDLRTDPEEKMFLTLKHGGPWLTEEQIGRERI